MRRRAFTGIRLHKFLPFVALGVAAACGSSNDDFFKEPNGMAGAKPSGKGGDAGSDSAGKGSTSGGDGSGATGGTSGSGATAGAGGTSDPGGTGGKDSKGGKGGSKGGQGGSAGTSKGGGGGHLDGGKGGSGGSGGSEMPGGDGGGGADGGSAGTGEGGDAGSPGGMSGSGGDMSLAGAGGNIAGAGGNVAGAGGSIAGAGGSGGSAAGSGGSGGAPPVTCGHDGDCDSGEYCQKSACEAGTGTCQLKAESCKGTDAELAPVCGCDGMTYYSACVAEREGVNVTSSGECTTNQATCTRAAGGSSCNPAREMARCYRPRTDCSGLSASAGVCWVLPDECPDEPKTTEYCAEAQCYGFCELLETDNAVRRNSSACVP